MSDLTDLEICKRIAKIEGYQTEYFGGYECCAFKGDEHMKPHIGKYDFIPYNPITDDGLCFRLMVKYGISVFTHEYGYYANMNSEHSVSRSFTESPNRAICLAIIAAHEGE